MLFWLEQWAGDSAITESKTSMMQAALGAFGVEARQLLRASVAATAGLPLSAVMIDRVAAGLTTAKTGEAAGLQVELHVRCGADHVPGRRITTAFEVRTHLLNPHLTLPGINEHQRVPATFLKAVNG